MADCQIHCFIFLLQEVQCAGRGYYAEKYSLFIIKHQIPGASGTAYRLSAEEPGFGGIRR